MRHLEEAQMERTQTNGQFEDLVKSGCSKAAGSADPWHVLTPAGLSQDQPVGPDMPRVRPTMPAKTDSQGKPVLPQLGSAVEKAITASLTPQLMTQGGMRIRDLRADFFQAYLAKDSGERARMVGSELERWQLQAKLELLKDHIAMSQNNHAGIMEQLRSSLEFKDDDPTDQLHRTCKAADAFHKQRAEFFDDQVYSAEETI